MITIRSEDIKANLEITKFPDGTSQAWKIDKQLTGRISVTFRWEGNESEVMHLIQVLDLLKREYGGSHIDLIMPYFPYARQDKRVSNNETFALHTFCRLLKSFKIDSIYTFDLHSNVCIDIFPHFENKDPWAFHNYVRAEFHPDIIFYPDKGAARRYTRDLTEFVCFGEKVRNQLTGNIESYKIANESNWNFKGKRVLIVDDICDGGATFVQAARELKRVGAGEISLCVSHGIFSKGFEEMKEAGISKFYTTNSLMKNKEGYKVYE